MHALTDKAVVVTGGSRGLGRGIVEALAARGARVTVVARNGAALQTIGKLGVAVLQDALLKATTALPNAGPLERPERWLFRIAHNAALDFLRCRMRREASLAAGEIETIVDPIDPLHDRLVVATSLRTFMSLPALQRSSVVLRDVLGYSIAETSEI